MKEVEPEEAEALKLRRANRDLAEQLFGQGLTRTQIVAQVVARNGVEKRHARRDVDWVISTKSPSNPVEQEALLLEAASAIRYVIRHCGTKLAKHRAATASANNRLLNQDDVLHPSLELGTCELLLRAAKAASEVASRGTISSEALDKMLAAAEMLRQGRRYSCEIESVRPRVSVVWPEPKPLSSRPRGGESNT